MSSSKIRHLIGSTSQPLSLPRMTLPPLLKCLHCHPSLLPRHSRPWVQLTLLCTHRRRVRMAIPSMHTRCTLPLAVCSPQLQLLSRGKLPAPSHHNRLTWPLLSLLQECSLVLHNPIGMVHGSLVLSSLHLIWYQGRVAHLTLIGIETNKQIGQLHLQATTPMILQRLVWKPNNPVPCSLTCPSSMSNLTSRLLLTSTIQALRLPAHLMHLLTMLPEKNPAVGSEVGTRQAHNVFSRSHTSEISVGYSCATPLYPRPQSKESACSVAYATKPCNQEHIWRESFHLGRCAIPQEIHRLLSRARSCTKVCP